MATVAKILAEVKARLGFMPHLRDVLVDVMDHIDLIEDGLAGDLVLDISPETVAPVPTSEAWTRNVVLTMKNTAGKTHTWLNQAFTTTLAIANTSVAGTATIVSTTLTFVNGAATIVISGDAEDWLDTETDTLTVSSMSILGHTVAGGTSVETFTAA